MALSTQQQILIEQRITNQGRSIVVAYLLWLFLGVFGGHRFYLGKVATAVVQLLMFLLGAMTAGFLVGFVLLVPLGIWLLIDAFLIPSIIRSQNNALRNDMMAAMNNEATH